MLQLSFEFAGDPQPLKPSPEPERPTDDLDRAYSRASVWSKALAARLGRPVRLVITDNRSTMLSAKPKGDRLEVRLHHMFLMADENILDAVADYLAGGQAAAKVLDEFIETHRSRYVASSRPQTALRTEGEHHDLRAIADDLAARHFGGPVDVKITWGKRVQPKKRQRSLQLGTYLPDDRLIRIHPVLDQDWVPQYFVEAVVFHEMLHHDMPAVVRNGRRHYHTRAFKRRERSFEYHAAAQAWEKDNLWRLLRGK
ncbi:MAG: hypothetical protein AAF997_05255 [Myxococcota bacterium]